MNHKSQHRTSANLMSPIVRVALLALATSSLSSFSGSKVEALPSVALPSIVTRATDSISALLSASGRQQQAAASSPLQQSAGNSPAATSQQQQVAGNNQWQSPSGGGAQEVGQYAAAGSGASNNSQSIQAPTQGLHSIQMHLSALQAQAQRQMSQLNQLVAGAANPLGATSGGQLNQTAGQNRPYGGNVLEVLSNVGKAIQQQISGASSGNIQIMAPSRSGSNSPANIELANTKKNEYQSIGESNKVMQTNSSAVDYRAQSEQLRQEILRRTGQLQQVVASSLELLKNNGDLIVRRLLEQLNHRLDQAKSKADKIISEPATNEVAIKALNTVNQGLNNLNNIITNIVSRLEVGSKDAAATMSNIQQAAAAAAAGSGSGGAMQRGAPTAGLLIDPQRFKLNLHQLGQQFSSAISAVQQTRQQQQQQQQLIGNNQQVAAAVTQKQSS